MKSSESIQPQMQHLLSYVLLFSCVRQIVNAMHVFSANAWTPLNIQLLCEEL